MKYVNEAIRLLGQIAKRTPGFSSLFTVEYDDDILAFQLETDFSFHDREGNHSSLYGMMVQPRHVWGVIFGTTNRPVKAIYKDGSTTWCDWITVRNPRTGEVIRHEIRAGADVKSGPAISICTPQTKWERPINGPAPYRNK